MRVQDIRIEDYHYDLPDHRIARYPLSERDASKLLIASTQQQEFQEDTYSNIHKHIPAGALMLFNNTKVIPARLHMVKPTGGAVEIFCLEPIGELSLEMTKHGESAWKCLVGGAKKWKEGAVSAVWSTEDAHEYRLSAEIIERSSTHFHIKFSWQPAAFTFAEVLSAIGQIPLPPYLDREAEELDKERYQTIYAHLEGSVAAPTAGLHFTETVFEKLTDNGVDLEYVTLHVGAGTFKPVSAATIGHHDMHAEYFDVPRQLLEKLIAAARIQRPVYAVGTTTLRTLESLFLMGCKLLQKPDLNHAELEIKQWDAYEVGAENTTVEKALQALLNWMDQQELDRIVAKTQLLIAPGYMVRMIDGLCTNFHQPGSTLLLLVAALLGDQWKTLYQYALDHDYRFLSYGDGCLIQLGK
jgi:S-adenosylmethionine:tRNA ribosyltransferase-isomerase